MLGGDSWRNCPPRTWHSKLRQPSFPLLRSEGAFSSSAAQRPLQLPSAAPFRSGALGDLKTREASNAGISFDTGRGPGIIPAMSIHDHIATLEAERDRLTAAIEALRGAREKRRGRRRGTRLSPAVRKRISLGMKKRWAARKSGKKDQQ